ncbi:uncharacterized protein ColSpa_06097 [Colletotrichum spaethianum]|uniref:Uncharacterized protein n=1 Tax=Colletotrichum spaethianum TaxID=700344 RepID=A0AA37LCM8_9PEZI|nr:uncharacterized protein ColSpa_06097 [Colletotrichum spaethianum]GKT45916.1 hypothetical protein ColSpa_06097 [Colletotrichum spaethianum]
MAQEVSLVYRTATITQCFTASTPSICNGCAPTPVVYPPTFDGGPICVEIQAPHCRKCGCDTCVQTLSYTTTYDAFCSTGLYKQEYAVTETYSGVAVKPTIPSMDVPLGFTSGIEVCTTCGPTPVTATITRPITGVSWGTAMPKSSPGGTGTQGVPNGSNGSSQLPPGPEGGGPGHQSEPGSVPGPGASGSQGVAPPAVSNPGSAPSSFPGATPASVVTADSQSIFHLTIGHTLLLLSGLAMTVLFFNEYFSVM